MATSHPLLIPAIRGLLRQETVHALVPYWLSAIGNWLFAERLACSLLAIGYWLSDIREAT
jgi:hypothetical protein